MASAKQTPRLMKSTLTKPHRWYVVTRYVVKEGVSISGSDAGTKASYLVAKEKFDVTDQMRDILASETRKGGKP